MNKQQRKALADIDERLCAIRSELETLQSDEQAKYDNMPEGLQGGDKGTKQEEVCQEMDTAVEQITEVIDAIDRAAQ